MINAYAKWFGYVVLLGVVINIGLSLLAFGFPEWLLGLLGLEPAVPIIWLRFAANLLILLSLFYIPAAIDLNRYQANAWLAVISRLAGFIFFLTQPRDYWLLGLIDFSFFIPEAILLILAQRNQTTTVSTS
ncbi:MAG: hypothetical protein F6K21_32115 [Symploca sp. SIO2D2]|nr:hypothetical protein [Symploca sp. SIO2D2]NER23758.1 hypothetical protein [Symploca sp. SIO1C2]